MAHEELPVYGTSRTRRPREPAAAHFHKLGKARSSLKPALADVCSFEMYRTDQVKMTSTRFSGGDWHWRLIDTESTVLIDVGGYRTESECRETVTILRAAAGLATPPNGG